MAVKTVFLCDVCGIEPKDDDTSTWRVVSIRALTTPSIALGAPVTMSGAPTGAEGQPTMVCHKPSCLTKWAKDQNENKPEPTPEPVP